MVLILIVVVGLVAWALYLMQEAVEHREFSLMLAGFLVSAAAAAMVAVYFLMGNYIGYMSQTAHHAYYSDHFMESAIELGISDIEVWATDFDGTFLEISR